MYQAAPPVSPGTNCSAKLQLFFRAEKLEDKDTFSKSDPYLVLFAEGPGQQRHFLGKTEAKKDTLKPKWETGINVEYFFESKQPFVAALYDDDGKGPQGDDSLGTVQFLLSSVMSSRGHNYKVTFGPKNSILYISAIEIGGNGKDELVMKMVGNGFKKMDTFGLSDPYFKMFRLLPSGQKRELFKSPVCKKTLDPVWPQCPRFRLEQLAGANLDDPTIQFEFWDEDFFSDDFIAQCKVSVNQLLRSKPGGDFAIPLVKENKPGKRYGYIHCPEIDLIHHPTFAEFLYTGWQINLAVSVDFTGSNGDPRNPKSLHFMDPHRPNQYSRAIMSVGEILVEYDSDKMIAAFGYGALLPNAPQTSHFFHLNMTENPYVPGVQGMLQAYATSLNTVRLSGPTNFAPTITAVANGATQAKNVYTVLLIITDGEITDMDDTVNAIVEADAIPLSIVIVGVGRGCDFEAMNQLDADGVVLRGRGGRVSRRDLVQFVPFRDFENAPPGALAAEVLKEIPDQFVRWAEITGVSKQIIDQVQQMKKQEEQQRLAAAAAQNA